MVQNVVPLIFSGRKWGKCLFSSKNCGNHFKAGISLEDSKGFPGTILSYRFISWPLNLISRDLFIILGHYVAHLEKPELNISKYHDHDGDTTSDC